ncbi:hypothetical protein EYF80_045081 [Liparis tanakae]|uniref:Uncharacterized protein n=1 Tax=Liparis tanakae TaxID=230148 RepID=A0A4Z2FU85_9TELE|nr:hypothetical protein EYF80_045081 [Liparis tanakae]
MTFAVWRVTPSDPGSAFSLNPRRCRPALLGFARIICSSFSPARPSPAHAAPLNSQPAAAERGAARLKRREAAAHAEAGGETEVKKPAEIMLGFHKKKELEKRKKRVGKEGDDFAVRVNSKEVS